MNVKKLRLAKKMTQTELAQAVGVTVRQVCKWEKDGLPKVYSRVERLKKVLL